MASEPDFQRQFASRGRVETKLLFSKNAYKYTPLSPEQIRILSLHPGSDENVSVSLSSLSLESHEVIDEFEALSYTWGSPTPERSIDCENQTISVTPNLYNALVAFRKPDTNRLLWVDQICINQLDPEEKSYQVQLMGAIYSKACSVVVWFSKEISRKLDLIDQLNKVYGLLLKAAFYVPEVSSGVKSNDNAELAALNSDVENTPPEAWNALIMIFENTYFTRVWMIQEVVLAKNCWAMIGECRVDWYIIEVMGWAIQRSGSVSGQITYPLPARIRHNTRCFGKMVSIRQRLCFGEALQVASVLPRWTLLDLVRMSWVFEATDKRDKVYALLGLLRLKEHCVPQDISIDYSSTTIYEQLVRTVFIQGLTMEGASLESLYCCSPAHPSALPSWLFDTKNPNAFFLSYELAFERDRYGAAGDSLPDIRSVPHDDSVLSFKTTRIGRVEKLAPPWAQTKTLSERVESGQKKFSVVVTVDAEGVYTLARNCIELVAEDGEDTEASLQTEKGLNLCKAFFCDIALGGKRFPISSSAVDLVNAEGVEDGALESGRRELDLIRRMVKVQKEDGWSINDIPEIGLVLKRISDVRFCRAEKLDGGSTSTKDHGKAAANNVATSNPLLCWVPLESEVGDIIVVIHGFQMPMLMRQISRSKDCYRFLGICYLHGFMDGQALKDGELYTEHTLVA